MSGRPKSLLADLLDNLWVWAAAALIIMFIYASWVLLESITMHTAEIPPRPP